jgi:serine/threonine protein kinase
MREAFMVQSTVSIEHDATVSATLTVLPRIAPEGAPAPSMPHEQVPRYQPLGALGEGGMGEVVKVHDHDIGRVVALKRLKPEMRQSPSVTRFIDEIRVIGQLEHPNIVPIHDVGVDAEGRHYFVMKYVHGETLESIIEKLAAGDEDYHRRYGFERRVQLFLGILEAIAFAHDAGFIHRDIKPANVMVGRFGEVVVMDWGIAKRIGGKDVAGTAVRPSGSALQTHVGALVGTPAYMSPEQARGQGDLDERSDIYSLCVLFYELLTLRNPLLEKSSMDEVLHAISHESFTIASFVRQPSAHQSPVPAELAWFLHKGLMKNKADRYPSVNAMIERLERRMEGNIPIQCHVTFTKRVTRAWITAIDRHPGLFTALLGLTLLAIPAAIAFALSR